MDWIKSFIEYKRIFRDHALQRMFQRNIDFQEFDEIISNLELVEEYPEDYPLPSCLILGLTKKSRPIHIVFAVNEEMKKVVIITVYEPDDKKWSDNFKRRKE